jgi:polyisoprenyl-phosphate glycosyltransferase
MANNKKLISLVIPAFNEAENIPRLYARLLPILDALAECYEFEIIFTDNHSTDETFPILAGLSQRDARLRVIRFSRNFGYQRSILAGYQAARGMAAVQLDCDLQDPPELLADFLARWEEGHQVVYGVRKTRPEGRAITFARQVFYRVIRALSENDLPVDSGDFRLVDRCILDILRQCRHADPYLRGTIAALGFSQTGVPYDRDPRISGKSKFSFGGYMRIALDGIVSQSVVPLRFATYFGLAIGVLALILAAGYLMGALFYGMGWPPGFATLVLLFLGGLSMNALLFGIMGEYIARIYRNSLNEPLTIIERVLPQETELELTYSSGL